MRERILAHSDPLPESTVIALARLRRAEGWQELGSATVVLRAAHRTRLRGRLAGSVHSGRGQLATETEDLKQQARASRLPEEGESLLRK
jgi:hypothetical protein